jgi:glycosyltransferase involved in cell wall biosynthesis
MKISVIIPCVDKHVELLKNLLESIKLYTRKPDEVIISVSPKYLKLNLNAIKKELEDKYSFVTCLVQSTITNVAVNRNNCLKIVTGDIIVVNDADDIMHPQKLEIIENIFTKYPDKMLLLHGFIVKVDRDYSLNYCNKIDIDKINIYTNIRSNTNLNRGKFPPVFIEDFDYKKIHPHHPFASTFATFSKKILENIKYDVDESRYNNVHKVTTRTACEDTIIIRDIHDLYKNTIYIDPVLAYYSPSFTPEEKT